MNIWRLYFQQHPRLGPWFLRANQRHGWVTACALTAGALVVTVPLLLLVFAAILVGLVVFVTLATIVRIITGIRTLWAGQGQHRPPWSNDGRRNVRVIHRD